MARHYPQSCQSISKIILPLPTLKDPHISEIIKHSASFKYVNEELVRSHI